MDKAEGFIHSVKVPRLYKMAAKIVQEVAEGGGSVKELIFQKKYFNTNALNALISTTLQNVHHINFLFKRTQLLEKESRLDPWLARILVTELLWGKKKLPPSACKPIQTVSGYEQVFKSHLSDNTGLFAEEPQDKKTKKKPRYVRINTILISFEEALDHFHQEGWILDEKCEKNDYKKFLERVRNLNGDYFMIDIHVPNLLIFPCGTKFFDHIGYERGWIILQDKASCLPVHILNPPLGSTVLDMCAAPGMKTTQLASALNDQGQIYAVERDERRYKSLLKMVESSGANNIKTLNKDILQCGPEDFPGVEYIVVDPSCSGSGMTDRIKFQEEQSIARLEKLSGFQIKILRTALTKYPNVKRVVYSTCSVYPEENEDVVRQVLETNHLFKLVDARTVIKQNWLNFGSSDFGKLGEFCLYAKPDQDLTNGFFVAVFERVMEGEKNEFFDAKLFNYLKKMEEKNKRREEKFSKRQKEFERQYGPVGDPVHGSKPADEASNQFKTDVESNQIVEKRKHRKKKIRDLRSEELIANEEDEIIDFYETEENKDRHTKNEKKHLEGTESIEGHDSNDEESRGKSYKRKKKNRQDSLEVISSVEGENGQLLSEKKHKKRKKENKNKIIVVDEDCDEEPSVSVYIEIEGKSKKRNKDKNKESGINEPNDNITNEAEIDTCTERSKKKKKKMKHQ